MFVYALKMNHKYSPEISYFRHLKASDREAAKAAALKIDGHFAQVEDIASFRKLSDRELADDMRAKGASDEAIATEVALHAARPEHDDLGISAVMREHIQSSKAIKKHLEAGLS